MSVRREKRRDPSGAVRQFWFIDIKFQHPDGRIQRVRKVSPVQTKRGAERYERELRDALLVGSYRRQGSENGVPTFAEFAEDFIATAETNNKRSSVSAKRSILKHHLLPAFGARKLAEIRSQDIELFKAKKLKAGLSPKSINNYLTVLRKALSVSVEWGLLSHVPKVQWMKVEKPKFDFLTFDEADRLLGGPDDEWRCMIVVALRTGLRLGELRGLQWDDLDLVAGRLVVRRSMWKDHMGTPKNGKTREVPLSDEAVCAFKRARHLKGDFVFCDEAGKPLTENACKWPLWRACRKAGLRRIRWHVLRHTFASHLVMRGVALKAVQELLGHATIEMSMRYAHLSPDVRRDAVQLLDRQPARGNVGATREE